jgi:hypothetical protein
VLECTYTNPYNVSNGKPGTGQAVVSDGGSESLAEIGGAARGRAARIWFILGNEMVKGTS